MCQAIKDGGRRCPVHRRDSIVAIYAAKIESGLPQDILEDLFVELRREGRHAQVSGLRPDVYVDFLDVLGNSIPENHPQASRYRAIFGEVSQEEPPAGDTLYAMRRLRHAAKSRATALRVEVNKIAARTGMQNDVAMAHFLRLRDECPPSADVSPEEYNALKQRKAFDANLPSDRASVVALQRLAQLRETGPRRITHHEDFTGSSGGMIAKAGYDPDGGRLEVSFSHAPDEFFAWRDVPEGVWNRIRNSERPGLSFNELIRGREEYQYSSEDEERADGYQVRCQSCGQFAASQHQCPNVVASPPATGLSVDTAEAPTRLSIESLPRSVRDYDPPIVEGVDGVDTIVFDGSAITPELYGLWERRSGLAHLLREDLSYDDPADEYDFTKVYVAREMAVALPSARAIEEGSRYAPVEIYIPRTTLLDPYTYAAAGECMSSLEGEVGVSRGENGEVFINAHLRCNCGRFVTPEEFGSACIHVELYRDMLQRYVESAIPGREVTADPPAAAWELDEIVNSNAYALAETAAEHSARTEARDLGWDEDITEEFVQSEIMRARETRQRLVEETQQASMFVRARDGARSETSGPVRMGRYAESVQSYYERVGEEKRQEIEAERAQFLADNEEFAQGVEAYYQARDVAWREVEAGFGKDLNRARRIIDEAQERHIMGERSLEPILDGAPGEVTDGICDPTIPGSRRFGVELEFKLKPSVRDKEQALANIARELQAEGLMPSRDSIGAYHSGKHQGYHEWSLERDGTVDAELVSPILSDTPEDWAALDKALQIIKRHGGVTDTAAGSHVHVSTGSYLASTSKHTELLRICKENEDILFRAAGDPSEGRHRGTTWCPPNIETPSLNIHKSDPLDISTSRPLLLQDKGMVSMTSSTEMDEDAHVEFRLWDASLDLATIQQQVATSVAIVDRADRKVEIFGESTPRASNPVGTFLDQSNPIDVGDEGLQQTMKFVDEVFRRQSDRERFLAMFAVNEWFTE